ncbi:hypothetical protein ACOMHN_033064 [Nucella lapillus]
MVKEEQTASVSRINKLEAELERQQRYSRRSNVLLYGMEEDPAESCSAKGNDYAPSRRQQSYAEAAAASPRRCSYSSAEHPERHEQQSEVYHSENEEFETPVVADSQCIDTEFEAASVHDRSAFDYVVDFKALMLEETARQETARQETARQETVERQYQEKCLHLQEQYQQLNQANHRLQQGNQYAQQQLQQENQQLQQENQQEKQQHQEEKQQLQQEKQQLQQEKQQLQQEKQQLQQEKQQLQQEKQQLQQENQQRIQQIQAQKEAVQSQLEEKEKHIYGLMDAFAYNTAEKERAVAQNQQSLNSLQKALQEKKAFQEMAAESRKRELLYRTQVAFRTVINRQYQSSIELLERQQRLMQDELTNIRNVCQAQQLNLTDALNQVREKDTELMNKQETYERENRLLKGRIYELEELQTSSRNEIEQLTEDRDRTKARCNRLTDAVEHLEVEKEQWLEVSRRKEEETQGIQREHDTLLTRCRVFERQKQTAEEQSATFGKETTTLRVNLAQQQTLTVEREQQFQATMNALNIQLQELREQMRQREREVLPLEMEARRAMLETQNMRSQLERMETENRNLEISVNALRGEIHQNTAAVVESSRREENMRLDLAREEAQKLRYIRETQTARQNIRALQDELRRH